MATVKSKASKKAKKSTKEKKSSANKRKKSAKSKSPSKSSKLEPIKSERAKKNRKENSSPWPIISMVVLLAIIIGAIILLKPGEYPVHASRAQVLEALRAHNVSEVLIVDLTNDFLSGNYTLKELEKRYPGYGDDIKEVNEEIKESEHEVVAKVNGEPITRSELVLQENMLPPQYRQLLSEDQILQQMIDEKLLMQEAKKENITVDEEEVERSYEDLLEKGNLTTEDLATNLATFGMTKEDLKEMIKKQLTIQKLFETALPVPAVTEEEARAFYDANQKLFLKPESVTVKHILIATKSRSDDEARTVAEKVLGLYKNGTDFCELVKEYSDDPGSKESCGEYTFGRGYMVPEFENASFSMKNGETRIVKTPFGEHVILKINSTPEETQPFSLVKEAIIAQLKKQKQTASYQKFINNLREKASITKTLAEKSADKEEERAKTMESAGTPEEEKSTEKEHGEEDSTDKMPAEQKEEASNKVTVTVEEPEAPNNLSSCLANKDVVLYTTDWATASQEEAEKYKGLVKVVDCSKEACEGINAYPTWKINGELHEGSMSKSELARIAGC